MIVQIMAIDLLAQKEPVTFTKMILRFVTSIYIGISSWGNFRW